MENELSWDTFGYYLYLPAEFIYNDITLSDMSWLNAIHEQYRPSETLYQFSVLDNGNKVLVNTMGMALFYAPFFFLAHFLTPILGYTADGFSIPYQISISLGGLIYSFIGILFLRAALKKIFNKYLATIVLFLIVMSTNYIQFATYSTVSPHNILFTLYAIMLFATLKWHEHYQLKYAVLIGFALGLIFLIRPTEMVVLFIPLLWGVKDKESLSRKYLLLKQKRIQLLAVAFIVIFCGIPQLIYWKTVSGQWFYYSYVHTKEGLELLTPHLFNFLFSFRKGWVVYTPLLFFISMGFYTLYQKERQWFYALFTCVVLHLYIDSSWSGWWYAGGSYSSRTMIPTYGLLAIPLGFFLQNALYNSIKRMAVSLLLAFFVILNLFQTWQFRMGIINSDRMTMAYYFRVFGKMHHKPEDDKLLLVYRSYGKQLFDRKEEYKSKPFYSNTFDESPEGVFLMDAEKIYSPGPKIEWRDLTKHDHCWIVSSIDVFIPDQYEGELPVLVTTFVHKGKNIQYLAQSIENPKYEEWNTISSEFLSPEVRSSSDEMKVYLWHRSSDTIKVDNLLVTVFEPKIE